MNPEIIATKPRRSRLGSIGEELAEEALVATGYQGVRNLNDTRPNQPFADIFAERDGKRYFISVKTRNESRLGGGLNESYNCFVIADAVNTLLKAQGKSSEDITQLALAEIETLALEFAAVPAWITVPVRPDQGTYAVYFGVLSDLGITRSIPMTPQARSKHLCLVDWATDKRIEAGLTNQE